MLKHAPRPSGGETTLRDVFRVVFRHWRKAALVFTLVMGGAAGWAFLSTPVYHSQSKLLLRLGRENSALDATATLGQPSVVAAPQTRENEVNSAVEVLASRQIAEKIVDEFGAAAILDPPAPSSGGAVAKASAGWAGLRSTVADWASAVGLTTPLDARERAILLMEKSLGVEAGRKSDIIHVSYQCPDPRLAQRIVGRVVDLYLAEHAQLYRPSGSLEFFEGQAQRVQAELSQAEHRLRDLKSETGLASTDEQRKLLIERIEQLGDRLLAATREAASARSEVTAMRGALANLSSTEVSATTSGVGNEGTDAIRAQLYALRVKEEEFAARMTDAHPALKQIRGQTAAAQALLTREEETRVETTVSRNPAHQQLELALLAAEPKLAALEASAAELKGQLATAQAELRSLNAKEVLLAAAKREVELRDADYRKYATNLEQARIDHALQLQRISNVSVAQPATLEVKPVRPKKLLTLVLGLMAGLAAAAGLTLAAEYFDHSFKTPEDVEARLDLPTLVAIPRLAPGQLTLAGNGRTAHDR